MLNAIVNDISDSNHNSDIGGYTSVRITLNQDTVHVRLAQGGR